MLEMLKKAEEGVNKFNNLPEEQRYYYDPEDKFVIHVTGLDQIRLEHSVYYKFKGHDIDDKNHWWFNFFYNTFEFVTKEEAIKQAEQDKSKMKKEIAKLKRLVESTQRDIQKLEEECNK